MLKQNKYSEFEEYFISVKTDHKRKRNFMKLLAGNKW